MDVVLFLFLFVFSLFLFIVGFFNIFVWNERDKFLFSIMSGVFFSVLMIQSLNIEYIAYDPNISDWVVYRMAEHGYEFLVPLAICLIMAAISLINSFIMVVPIWNKNFRKSDMKGFYK